ncbi:hypothetical protein [Nonomuraea fuscirosea]|uniref:hypothetical protein n=1 Tax=Nonomuraea fuscirosea TaxID=1291556 RepID=UPI003434D778
MNNTRLLAALSAGTVAAALIALPAQAETRPSCPAPPKAALAKALKPAEPDRPAKGATAIKGVRVGHLPKGFVHGAVTASKHHGLTEYGYRWSDDRDDVDRAHRSLWVRVVCWPKAGSGTQLTKVPLVEGRFTSAKKSMKIGQRRVLVRRSDGALGTGRYAGWVERRGVIVTVHASEGIQTELIKIIQSIKL